MSKKVCLSIIIIFLTGLQNNLIAGSAKRISYRSVSYDVYIANPQKDKIHFSWKDAKGDNFININALKLALREKKKKLEFATNGGIYEWGLNPLGLYIENKIVKTKANYQKGKGNFYLQPNGVFYVTKHSAGVMTMKAYKKRPPNAHFATQSGPMLVLNSRVHPIFRSKSNSRYIRNGVGIDRHGRAVFVISNSPVNLYTFASFFKRKMKCTNALYLDGSISRMYLPAKNRHDLDGHFAVIISVSKPLKKR